MNLLGQIEIKNKIIAIDPCYEKISDGLILDMDHGVYDVFTVSGKMKDPLFRWDTHPLTFRNFEIIIQKTGTAPSDKLFKEVGCIGVDSGQAGFFDLPNYQKDFNEEKPLEGDQYYFFRESIISDHFQIERSKKMKKDEPDLYNKILKEVYKGNEKKYQEHENMSIEMKKNGIKRSKEILKTRNYPHYMPLKHSKDFYKVMCSLTLGENSAGVIENHAVSSSGLGDGGYSVKVASLKGKNIAALISFLDLQELKD